MPVLSDLAWWFGWSPSDIWQLDVMELPMWIAQMHRQIKAGYARVF
ncbi:GpE family phage tail protein [Chelonobacter oris]|nr:GpE family phage tail protein [Chelonobacter oris]